MKIHKYISFFAAISILIGGGYYPSYGPGFEWNTIESTTNAFIIFDSINIDGVEIDSGQEGGVSGSCPGNDCDIVGAIYNGICVGWTYAPVVNGGVTLGIQLNDGLTVGIEDYPQVNAAFAPVVTFNLFDVSEGVMFYNIASSPLQVGTATLFGALEVVGDGDFQSSDGFLFGEPTDFPLGNPVCNVVAGPDGYYVNFTPFGASGNSLLCGYGGCMDSSADNYDSSAVEDDESCVYAGCTNEDAINYNLDATIDDDSCGFVGCNDPTAGNFVENGPNYTGQLYDCSGNPGILDMSCCQFMGCNVEGATNYVDTSSDCLGEVGGNNDSCCTYAPTDINTSFIVIEEIVNSEIYSTSNLELSWNESDSCPEGTEWSYLVCLDNSSDCDTTSANSIIYDIGWNNSVGYSIFAYGCALDIYDELYGFEVSGTLNSDERPVPEVPNTLAIVDDSGEGYVELSWNNAYQADYYNIVFTNINNMEDLIEFRASGDSSDIVISTENGMSSAILYPLGAGKTYSAKISSVNLNSFNEEQNSSYSLDTENIVVLDFPEAPIGGFMDVDTTSYPYSIELLWDSAPNYGTYLQEWTYEIFQTGIGSIISTTENSALVSGLNAQSSYEFIITATSGYGQIQGAPFIVSTTADGDGADWGFQVKVNHLGYGYIPVDDENNFFGFADEATNYYDNNLDIVEPPSASDFVKFYFVREDWEEDQIGWGSHYTQEVRSRHDEEYAFDNYSEEDLAIFNAQLISNMPGFATLDFDLINFYGDAPVNKTDANYCPVFLKLIAFDEIKYYKIEDNTRITIQINGWTEYDMEFIVGNMVPVEIDNFIGMANNTQSDPFNLRPFIDLSWENHDECVLHNDVEICNSISSRYPQTSYVIEFNDGSEDVELSTDILSYSHPEVGSLSYETEYSFILSGKNNSGKGESSQISVQTFDNLSPNAYAGSSYDDECVWDDYGCGNTYLTPHDGNPNSSNVEVTLRGSGFDPEGLGLRFYWNQISGDSIADLSETYSIQSLIDSAVHEPTFQAGLALSSQPLVYEFELAVTDTFPIGLTQNNGFSVNRDTVKITILPESNLSPVSFLDVTRTYNEAGDLVKSVDYICMAGDTIIYNFEENSVITNQDECEQTDGEWVQHNVNDFLNWNWEAENQIGPIWRVPHDGNPITNFANIQLVNKSYDLDGGESFSDINNNGLWDLDEIYTDINQNGQYDEQLDEIYTLWNRTTPPETYIDANNNGIFDYGEPFNDLNNNGYYDWSEAINLDVLTTRSTPGVDTVQIFIEDSYGYKDTSQMIILILEEPNEEPVVSIGQDKIVFIEPEYESTYSYKCDNPEDECYPIITDADNDVNNIVDTLSISWHNGSNNIEEEFILPEGDHELTLCATDPYGAEACDTKVITVYQEPLPDKVNSFNSYQDLYYIELTWEASDLLNLSDEYSDLGYDDSLLQHIEMYPYNLNAARYEIYRNNELLSIVNRETIDQTEFRYIDNGLNPSTTYEYKIIPLNSHGRAGVPSDDKIISTTDRPTIRLVSPNGTEIWASSYYDPSLGQEIIRAFPVDWEMTSVQNIQKINIYVSHDNGQTWEQAENFYEKNIEAVCSDGESSNNECEDINLELYLNPMSCEAMGHKWVYDGIDKCFAQLVELDSYSEDASNQDLAVQEYTQDAYAISPQIDFTLDSDPELIFNQGDQYIIQDVVEDATYIKGEGIEINHNTLVKIVAYDRGDYFDIYNETPPNGWNSSVTMIEDVSDGSFTLSSNKVTRIFDIGWHLFGPPVKPYIPRMFDAFQEPHGFGDWAYDWISFAQSGSFSDLYMQMGRAYYLNNTSIGNLTIYGDPVINSDFLEYDISDINSGNYSIADIKLNKGWNLISNTLVRPITKYNFEVIHLEDNSNYTYDQAVSYGFVQPNIYGYESGYYTTNSIYPFEGYFLHAARGDMLLKIRPHDFEQLGKVVENDVWELELTAKIEDNNYRDRIVVGLGQSSKDGFKYGEDEVKLPPFTDEAVLNLAIEENFIGEIDENGNIAESNLYYSSIKSMINEHQSQVWKINFENNLPESPLELSWHFEEINDDIDINLYFEGKVVNMKTLNSTVLNTSSYGSFILVVGQNPLASSLGVPLRFNLGQAYPNPFNPVTSFKVELNNDGYANINIYNVTGQLIKEIHNGFMPAGYHQLSWDASYQASGLYILKVKQGDNNATQKLLLIK